MFDLSHFFILCVIFAGETRSAYIGRHSPPRSQRFRFEKTQIKSPETEELKRLKRKKEIQDLVVKDEEKYVAEPLDPDLFHWDDK